MVSETTKIVNSKSKIDLSKETTENNINKSNSIEKKLINEEKEVESRKNKSNFNKLNTIEKKLQGEEKRQSIDKSNSK